VTLTFDLYDLSLLPQLLLSSAMFPLN